MSLDLSDLVAFFESEPTLDEHDVPWQYSGALFRYVSGEDSITCRIAPGEGLLSVSWRQAEVKRIEVGLTGFFDIQLECQPGFERLVAISDSSPPFVIQLKPHVFIALGVGRF